MEPVLEPPSPPTVTRRKIVIIGVILAAITVCPLIVWAARLYLPAVWGNLHFVNFVVAWIPAVLSILVAFVPDRELEARVRIGWRLAVVFCGVIYSVTLWHQQGLADAQNITSQKALLSQAIQQADNHADQQFGKIQGQVSDLNTALGETQKVLVQALNQSNAALKASIGKVGKPSPPVPAKILFSLWSDTSRFGQPIWSTFATANADGTYSVSFIASNVSTVPAKDIDIWVDICQACKFAKEPEGFEHPKGMPDETRHARLGSLNPGMSYQVMTVTLEVPQTPGFQIGLRYDCSDCGGKPSVDQILTIRHVYTETPHFSNRMWKVFPSTPKAK